MNFITRAQWGARSPSKLNSSGVRVPVTPVIVPWADRIGVAYHIQDGNRANGPANLQNYAMDSLNYSDSHYNLSTKDGTVYEQRGITVLAAHAATSVANHNRAWVGVVVFGRNGDVTDLDLQTLTEIHHYIETQAGKPLLFKGHGQLFGSQTACPDQKILNWIANGGPRIKTDVTSTKGSTMFLAKRDDDGTPESATVYKSNGFKREAIGSEAIFNAARSAGIPLVTVADDAALESLCGPMVVPPMPVVLEPEQLEQLTNNVIDGAVNGLHELRFIAE